MILANVRNSENDEKFAITRNSSTYGKKKKLQEINVQLRGIKLQ